MPSFLTAKGFVCALLALFSVSSANVKEFLEGVDAGTMQLSAMGEVRAGHRRAERCSKTLAKAEVPGADADGTSTRSASCEELDSSQQEEQSMFVVDTFTMQLVTSPFTMQLAISRQNVSSQELDSSQQEEQSMLVVDTVTMQLDISLFNASSEELDSSQQEEQNFLVLDTFTMQSKMSSVVDIGDDGLEI